jgi:hypothetical protein
MTDHRKEYEEGRLETTSLEAPKHFGSPAPDPELDPITKQHKAYWVLSEAERAKGFVRPVRDRYRHETCGSVTTMGRALSETYAREPGFYGRPSARAAANTSLLARTASSCGLDDGEKVGT